MSFNDEDIKPTSFNDTRRALEKLLKDTAEGLEEDAKNASLEEDAENINSRLTSYNYTRRELEKLLRYIAAGIEADAANVEIWR